MVLKVNNYSDSLSGKNMYISAVRAESAHKMWNHVPCDICPSPRVSVGGWRGRMALNTTASKYLCHWSKSLRWSPPAVFFLTFEKKNVAYIYTPEDQEGIELITCVDESTSFYHCLEKENECTTFPLSHISFFAQGQCRFKERSIAGNKWRAWGKNTALPPSWGASCSSLLCPPR